MPDPSSLYRVRIWDLPTRVFHWASALCVLGLAVTGTVGGSAMVFHFRFGYALLTLLLFRLVWGLMGGHWSRFRSFVFGPRAVFAYLRGRAPASHSVGHSPIGALSVWALLFFLSLQVATGLISDDEISTAGPLTHLVSNASVSLGSQYHTELGKWILLALVLLHVAAIIYLVSRRQGLLAAMLHGDKQLPAPAAAARDDARSRITAFLLLCLCAAAVFWLSGLAPAGL
jgi:cytochrome b